MLTVEGRRRTFSMRMYGIYLEEARSICASGQPISLNFLVWHRARQDDPQKQQVVYRGGKHQQTSLKAFVVACRYWYELTDGYWGQMVLTQIPHSEAKQILPTYKRHLSSMQHFVGMIEYLLSWKWTRSDTVSAAGGMMFSTMALPFRVTDNDKIDVLVSRSTDDPTVFATDRLAFQWLFRMAERDLQYRGIRDEHLDSFRQKQKASF